ncbi:outer membrane autotransporter barrel domain protein, partial [Burkholderia sp. H160]
KANDDAKVQTAVAVGGSGGAAGSGGAVSVTKDTSGNIETQGVAAFGIYAQSVGGGGGNGALAGAISGSLKSLSIAVGGNGGGAGDGGTVSVNTSDTSNATGIQTTGKHSIGILAQSVGGGGGVVTTMSSDETFDPSKIINNPQGRLGDIYGMQLSFGGQNGSSGKGGNVDVAVNGNIQTQGLDAHGMVAQSIGGGGGFVVGGQVNLPAAGTGGAGGAGGDGGAVAVNVKDGFIGTSSDGAYGVIAQSIGGGGGFAGDPSQVQSYQPGTGLGIKANSGNGGTVSVAVDNALITTSGKFAPAVFAQSVGGGGGLEAYSVDGGAPQVLARGTAGGKGTGNAVDVELKNGAIVRAFGSGSAGILAQSDGTSSGPIRISIDSSSSVMGGAPSYADLQHIDSAAIHLLGGTGNQIINAGTISTNSRSQGQFAIVADGPTSTQLTNTGKITGDIVLGPSSTNVVNNLAGGVIDTPTKLNIGGGTVNNAGTLKVGGAKTVGNTVLTGNLVQSPTGTLNVQIDPASKRSDLLNITGTAALAGKVHVDPVTYLKSTSTVLAAAGGIQPDATLAGTSTPVYRFTPLMQGNTVAIKTDADFVGASKGASATQQSVAANLDRLWNSADPTFAPIFGAFGNVGSTSGYAQTLTAVSGQELLGVAAARYQSSQAFARSVFSCPVFADDDTTVRKQGSCVWFRATGMWENRSADASFPGFGWQGTTMKVGGQVQLQPGWFLGGAIGYETDRFTGNDNLTSASGNALLGVVALKHEVGPWTFTGAVDASYGWLNSSRVIPTANAVATASPDSFNVGLHMRAAYQIPFGRFYLEPALDGDLNYINLPGYTESGAGALNLKVNSANSVIATGTPNLRIGTRAQIGSATVDAYIGAGVSFIAGNTYTTNASFAAAPGFGSFTNTLTNAHVAGKFSAGVEVYTTKRLDVRLEYDGVVAAQEVENGGQIRFKYRF